METLNVNRPLTYFAPPERATEQELAHEMHVAAASPVISSILQCVGGLIVVLDRHRQIVALNDPLSELLGISDIASAAGLRLGEAVKCIYAETMPAGCGTSQYCRTCGAVIAMVAGLETNEAAEQVCSLSIDGDDGAKDMVFRVRCQPVQVDQTDFLLIFLQDVTEQHMKSALERVFYHDISNMLTALVGASEIMATTDQRVLAQTINKASHHLLKEVSIQRCLSLNEIESYVPEWQQVMVRDVIEDLKAFFGHHGLTHDKILVFPKEYPDHSLKTDMTLLLRILSNMLINSLEASGAQDEIRISLNIEEGAVLFHVWNRAPIPQDIAIRVFQRNFSTKGPEGRGLGTYSMKLFGEKVLNGKVGFVTSEQDGTTFTLEHPA